MEPILREADNHLLVQIGCLVFGTNKALVPSYGCKFLVLITNNDMEDEEIMFTID